MLCSPPPCAAALDPAQPSQLRRESCRTESGCAPPTPLALGEHTGLAVAGLPLLGERVGLEAGWDRIALGELGERAGRARCDAERELKLLLLLGGGAEPPRRELSVVASPG